MNLSFLFLPAVEKSIEAVLKMDPDTRGRLASINGKSIRVNISSPAVSLLLSVAEGRVLLALPDDNDGLDPDLTISGSIASLRSLLDGNDAVYTGDVGIEGDIGTSGQLKQILVLLDPDWQDALSPYLGDGLTHRLDMAQADLGRWLRRTREGVRQNTSEYLQEEVEVLAPNSEVQLFCAVVDDTRAAADRLTARVQRLEAARDTQREES